MPLVQRAVAFDSINFLPGFPSDSVYQCDPLGVNPSMGGCADPPSVVGREAVLGPAGVVMARAIAAAKGASPSLGSCGGSCGCGGTCGGGLGHGDGGSHSHEHDHDHRYTGVGHGDSGSHSRGYVRRAKQTMALSLGDYGLPDFTALAGDPLGYLKSNAFPIVLGALAVYLIKKR